MARKKKEKSFLESYTSFKNQLNRGKPETVAKRERESGLKYSSANPDKVKQYNSARKEMGLSEDSYVTQKKFQSMFGSNRKINGTMQQTNKGEYARYKEYQSEQTKPSSSLGGGSSNKTTFKEKHPVLSKTLNIIKKVDNERERATNRISNIMTFGLGKFTQNKENELLDKMKKEHNDTSIKKRNDFSSKDRSTVGKVGDFLSDSVGYLNAGGAIQKGLKGTKLAATIGKDASKLKKISQMAKEGASVGGIISALETPMKKINDKESNKDTFKRIALETGLGAVADPLVHGVGKGINKLLKNSDKVEVAKNKELNEATKKLIKRINSGKVTSYDAKQLMKTIKNPEQVKVLEEVMQGKSKIPKPGAKFENAKPVEVSKLAQTIEKLPKKEPTHLNIDQLPKQNVMDDPKTAPILKKVVGINEDIPYVKGDPLPDTTGHIVTKTKLVPKSLKEVSNTVYTKSVDNYHPIKQAIKNYEKEVGRKLNPDENAYILALNSRHSDMTVNQMLNENMVNKNGDVIGDSLKTIYEPIKNDSVKQTDFSDYLINKHAITRMDRGEKVFPDEMQMNSAKSKAKVAEYEAKHPEFKEQSDRIYNFDKQVLEYGKELGLLDDETIKGLRKANPFYSPNQRSFSELEKINSFGGGKKGFVNQNNTLKKATGSERPIVDPIESRIENVDKIVKAGKKNEVMTSLIKLTQENPEAMKPFMELVPTDEGVGAMMDSKTVQDMINKDGFESFLDEFNKMYDQKPDLQNGNTVFGLIDGKKVHVKVNDLPFLEALTNLDPMSRDFVTRNVGGVTNMFKTVTTGINPFFSLRNAMRDAVQGYANSKTVNNPIKYASDLGSAIVNVIKNDVEAQAFKNIGGGHSSSASADRNLLAQSKGELLGNKTKMDALKNLPKLGLNKLENFNNILEMAPRLAEYKRVKNEYNKLQENPNYKSKVLQAGVSEHGANIQGLYEANDITLNFKKFGNHTKNVDAYVPYLNAAVQGLDKLIRSFIENPVKYGSVMVAKSVAAISIPTAILYAKNHDDPAYQQLSDEVKDQNFVIPLGDGTFFKIPKPRELSVMFGAPVERTMRSMMENDPDAFKHFSDSLMHAFLPPTRTIGAPLNDIRANKDYNGAPIVPMDLAQGSPENQYNSRTSEVAKGLGKLTNTSPMKLDYLAKSYGGLFSQVGIPATSEGSSVGDVIKRQYVADPVFSNDLTRDFYDVKEKVDQAYYDNTHGHPEVKVDLALREDLKNRQKAMSDTRKLMKFIQNNKDLSKKKKEKDLRDLQEKINQFANLKKR